MRKSPPARAQRCARRRRLQDGARPEGKTAGLPKCVVVVRREVETASLDVWHTRRATPRAAAEGDAGALADQPSRSDFIEVTLPGAMPLGVWAPPLVFHGARPASLDLSTPQASPNRTLHS